MRVLVLALGFLAAACSNSGDGAPDGSSDAAVDRWHGCTGGRATACLTEYPPCPLPFDGGCGAVDGGRVSVGTCGPYAVWSASGKDTTETVYFDSAGNIVAITNASPAGDFCVDGPSGFTPPACTLELCDGG